MFSASDVCNISWREQIKTLNHDGKMLTGTGMGLLKIK